MENRVVITGMGIYSCIGTSLEEVRESLFHGKSGIVLDKERKEFGFRSGLTGVVPKPDLKNLLNRRQRVSMGEESEYAYLATVDALKQANLDEAFLESHEVGILYGNDSVSQAVVESIDIAREKKDTTLMGSGAIFKSMNSTVTMNLSTIFKLKGINLTISAACASGSHSLGLAYMMIKNGFQEMIICGGAQETNKYSMASFDGLGVFSAREDEPAKASRPFDAGRDGLIPSGGAASLIVESLESAQRRGAPIIAEIIGYGFSSNGGHISTPNVDGPALAMDRALKQSGLKASDIDYINAHATSTPIGDANEARAIYEIFGNKVPVSSTKSMTGHECWMAGASEVIYSILMMQNDFVAPNINLENPDNEAQKINLVSKTKNQKIDVFLSNSFGFGGTNSALIVKKFD
ncbi:beta-ketoacyl-[acyl-carrier-protein] synthase family protein [Chryseobacterium indologenes]|uniref:beta-ketoacyl-[acyl-carrier-protein] synthase family protein n=1 Tax=Chryseobacterium indologenes TaxID=253 RepID=UPI000F4E573A|nr:beta-ketoacyl-[acyl-carrier-protein] synthase family protein [Chryseobacterium indologenes]AYZ34096.1 beta-ketoacyl-[acyl-carrier-protein] synthase family protein [Chryseobacterium indologenes]MBF6642607.1 beta-ketoacyl-[acyl-carrier-protein] synthase family protein [Chryseobacterium indologenes]MBU3047365.1 beta-ketoacyl-[acyl-carrier-protein] synthase family protein [Chryseobacterium indologenes]MEB4761157.1 beta-ketoacyl-[acyl-carrier-protein] synthase family protein [Chryseobacterium ind